MRKLAAIVTLSSGYFDADEDNIMNKFFGTLILRAQVPQEKNWQESSF